MIDKKIVLEFIIALFGYDFLALINKVSTNDTISFKKSQVPPPYTGRRRMANKNDLLRVCISLVSEFDLVTDGELEIGILQILVLVGLLLGDIRQTDIVTCIDEEMVAPFVADADGD